MVVITAVGIALIAGASALVSRGGELDGTRPRADGLVCQRGGTINLCLYPEHEHRRENTPSVIASAADMMRDLGFSALHNPGCSRGLNPPASSRARAM